MAKSLKDVKADPGCPKPNFTGNKKKKAFTFTNEKAFGVLLSRCLPPQSVTICFIFGGQNNFVRTIIEIGKIQSFLNHKGAAKA